MNLEQILIPTADEQCSDEIKQALEAFRKRDAERHKIYDSAQEKLQSLRGQPIDHKYVSQVEKMRHQFLECVLKSAPLFADVIEFISGPLTKDYRRIIEEAFAKIDPIRQKVNQSLLNTGWLDPETNERGSYPLNISNRHITVRDAIDHYENLRAALTNHDSMRRHNDQALDRIVTQLEEMKRRMLTVA